MMHGYERYVITSKAGNISSKMQELVQSRDLKLRNHLNYF